MDKYKFVRSLRLYPLTRQQVKTLRGQALAGDLVEVESLGNADRGGIGSTGVR